ncbi:MAG: PAS domain-containing protein [Streptosporangiaceae bacterium]
MSQAEGAAIVLVDAEGTIRYLSEAMAALVGRSPEEAVGLSLDLLVPADYRQRHWAGFRSAMASGTASLEGMAGSIPCCAPTARCAAGRAACLSSATREASRWVRRRPWSDPRPAIHCGSSSSIEGHGRSSCEISPDAE